MQYGLPGLWILFSSIATGLTVPVVLLRQSIERTAKVYSKNINAPRPTYQVRSVMAHIARRDADIRLMVLLSFALVGISALGIFPPPLSRIVVTIVLFADNAALGYKSWAEYKDLTKALFLAEEAAFDVGIA